MTQLTVLALALCALSCSAYNVQPRLVARSASRLPRRPRGPSVAPGGSRCSPEWLFGSVQPNVPQSAGPNSVTQSPNLLPSGAGSFAFFSFSSNRC